MDDLTKMAHALTYWQGVAAMYEVEFAKLNEANAALMERIDVLKAEIEQDEE